MANRSAETAHAHRGNGRHHAPRAKAPPSPYGQRAPEVQPYGTLVRYPLGLGDDVRARSVEDLNVTLADTCVLRDLFVSDVLRTTEMQVWFLAEHLADPASAAPRGSR